MSRFIENDKGQQINLDHVHVIQRKGNKDGPDSFAMYGADDEYLGMIAEFLHRNTYISYLLQPVIPAVAGQFAYMIYLDAAPNEFPSDVYVEQTPIIGWIVIPEDFLDAKPVLTEHVVSNCTVGVPCPDGRVSLPGHDTSCDDLEAAKRYVLKEAQGEWNMKYGAKAAAE